MIFWILTVIAVLVLIGSLYADSDQWGAQILTIGLLWAVFVLGGTSVSQAQWGERTSEHVQEYRLNALATRDHHSGAYFFLGTGVAEKKPVYRYMEVSADGGNRMKEAPIERSVVYEVSTEPAVKIVTWSSDSWWWTPWAVPSLRSTEYRFYIPEGSIVQGYEVAP